MKLINQSVEFLEQKDIFQHIERCARVCYQSEPNETTSKEFVDKLIERGHLSMLEHGTVYLYKQSRYDDDFIQRYKMNKYSKENSYQTNNIIAKNIREWDSYITSNYRVIYENDWLDDLKYQCEPTEFHEKRYTFKIVTSIGIVRELLRHRNFSFANESTRYCNYSKGKFDREITFIEPYWYKDIKYVNSYGFDFVSDVFDDSCVVAETHYNQLINEAKLTPQQARDVLPLCTKSELIMTGFESDWKDFLDKRYYETTGKVHPDMKEIATMIKEKLVINTD